MIDIKLSPVRQFDVGTQTVGARLCYFGSGSAELVGAHKDWIERHFAPVMKANPNAWIDLIGHSSTSGSVAANIAICNQRMDAVERFVKGTVTNIKVNVKEAKGSEEAQAFSIKPNDPDGYWRAVTVRWWGITTPIPVPLYPPDTADWMKRVYRLMPTAEIWRAAAERVLTLAQAGLQSSFPSAEQNHAMDLVDRVFKLTPSGQSTSQSITDIQQIRGVFVQMKQLIHVIIGGALYLHESVEPGHDGDNAYTFEGHWALRNPADGIWYVKKNIEPATNEFIVDASIHEFAHFCGPMNGATIGHAIIGGQKAYGLLALQLGRSDALRNASSYAWLAFLARKPSSQWLTATS